MIALFFQWPLCYKVFNEKQSATSLAPGISNIDLGLSSDMKEAYAESYMIKDPFAFAKSTSSFSCCLVAALPVGLFGEQKKITSALGVDDKSGKKLFSGTHFMYTMFLYFFVSAWNLPALPIITLESTYACHGETRKYLL